jgi:hypothetical protein
MSNPVLRAPYQDHNRLSIPSGYRSDIHSGSENKSTPTVRVRQFGQRVKITPLEYCVIGA